MCKYSDDLDGYKCPHKSLLDSDYCIFHLQDDNKDINEFNKGKNFKFKIGLNAINQISADNIEILRYARLLNIPASEILQNFQIQLDKKSTLQQNYINLANIALEFVSLYPITIIKNVKVGFLELNLEYKIIKLLFRQK